MFICVASWSYIAWEMETFEVNLALEFRMGFKRSNNLVFLSGIKQTDSKLNTQTQRTLPVPVNIHTADWTTVSYEQAGST